MMNLNNINFNYKYLGKGKNNDGWEHRSYMITISNGTKTEVFNWFQGLGVENPPTLDDILNHLLSEMNFYQDDIYSLYQDEEKAEKIIKELKQQSKKMENLFTNEELGDLIEYYEEF